MPKVPKPAFSAPELSSAESVTTLRTAPRSPGPSSAAAASSRLNRPPTADTVSVSAALASAELFSSPCMSLPVFISSSPFSDSSAGGPSRSSSPGAVKPVSHGSVASSGISAFTSFTLSSLRSASISLASR